MILAALILSMRLAPFEANHKPQYSNGVCLLHAHVEICEPRSRRAFFVKALHLSDIA